MDLLAAYDALAAIEPNGLPFALGNVRFAAAAVPAVRTAAERTEAGPFKERCFEPSKGSLHKTPFTQAAEATSFPARQGGGCRRLLRDEQFTCLKPRLSKEEGLLSAWNYASPTYLPPQGQIDLSQPSLSWNRQPLQVT